MLSVSSSMNKMKVSKCELPIDVLKTGVEVDLSGQKLEVEDAIIIAACISVNSSMISIDISSNDIRSEGAVSVSEALKSSTSSLTSINLSSNNLAYNARGNNDMTGVKAIADALSVSTSMNSLK